MATDSLKRRIDRLEDQHWNDDLAAMEEMARIKAENRKRLEERRSQLRYCTEHGLPPPPAAPEKPYEEILAEAQARCDEALRYLECNPNDSLAEMTAVKAKNRVRLEVRRAKLRAEGNSY
jgi:hypothetical protein